MKVLVIDDEAALADSISCFLQLKGHDVTVFRDGEEVLTHLTERDHENRYDAMLIDIFMPGLEGVELIQMIRRALVFTKIIVMSGQAERNGSKLAELVDEYDVSAVVKKPFKANELLQYLEA